MPGPSTASRACEISISAHADASVRRAAKCRSLVMITIVPGPTSMVTVSGTCNAGGDMGGVEGAVMTSHTGELSVKVESFQLLSKGIRPLPEKGHPLTDLETRYRQRYVDLVVNENTQRIFEIRIKAIDAIRQHLREQGFWEVETPVLQSIQGGATARPFITHHNAL